VRKYVNPAFTISFDCASPFLATANGQVYHHIDLPDQGKWCYRMSPIVDDKKYATDTRSYRDAVLQDGLINHFDESPISARCQIRDICVYKPGVRKTDAELNGEKFDDNNMAHFHVPPDLNKIGKNGKTSWDSFSYALLMGHNVWMHIESVQRANRAFDSGTRPYMMQHSGPGHEKFEDLVEAIFATPDRQESLDIIEHYSKYWMEIIGTRGFKGKKTVSARPQFNALFSFVEEDRPEEDAEESFDESKLEDLTNQNS